MDVLRPVRCELTMEEANLLISVLREKVTQGGDTDTLTSLLAHIQQAEDHALERTTMRGPETDAAEYEW